VLHTTPRFLSFNFLLETLMLASDFYLNSLLAIGLDCPQDHFLLPLIPT
jgi:hypothetical protein